jgi:type IV pilus assembly protein PilC
MNDQSLVQWFRQMAVLLNCGIPAKRALEICCAQTSSESIRQASSTILSELQVGQRLSQAMACAASPFEPLHWGALEIGESHGDLARVFERLADHSEETTRVRRRLISALAYPALVILISLLGLYLLVRFLSPVLAEVGAQLGDEPNLVSKGMLFLGGLFERELLSLSLLLGFCWLLRFVARRLWRHRRTSVERAFFALPLLGKMFRLTVLVRVCQTLETMIGGGLAITEAFRLTAKTCGSAYYAEQVLIPSVERIRRGETIGNSLRGSPGLPASFFGLLLAGEESGSLDDSFKYLGRLYEMELVTAVESFLSALEPLAISFVGTVVLGILLSVFMPLSKLVTSV